MASGDPVRHRGVRVATVTRQMNDETRDALTQVRFPRIAARDLEGRERVLPEAFRGVFNLVIVAFRREQQAMADTWVSWFETVADKYPELRCYEIPVLSRRWSPARFFIDGGMARAVREKEARRRTLTIYTDVRRVTEALAIDDTRTVTALLVDAMGSVFWRTTGSITAGARSSVVAKLRESARVDGAEEAGGAAAGDR